MNDNSVLSLISKEIIQRKGKSDKKTYYVFSGNLAEIIFLLSFITAPYFLKLQVEPR